MATESIIEEEMENINRTIISSFTTKNIRDVISLISSILNKLDENIQAIEPYLNSLMILRGLY